MKGSWGFDELVKQVTVDGLQSLRGLKVPIRDLGRVVCENNSDSSERSVQRYFNCYSDMVDFIFNHWEQAKATREEYYKANIFGSSTPNFVYCMVLEGVREYLSENEVIAVLDDEVLLTQELIDEILNDREKER